MQAYINDILLIFKQLPKGAQLGILGVFFLLSINALLNWVFGDNTHL